MFEINNKMLMALKQAGIKTDVLECEEVIIKKSGEIIKIKEPKILVLIQGNSKTYIMEGKGEIKEEKEDFNEDDVKFVMEHAKIDEEKARELLKKAKGDIAEALLMVERKD
jgi:alpha-NAC-related protein